MKRKKAEKKILKHMEHIAEVMRDYNPDNDYLSLCIMAKSGCFLANNEYWGDDADKPISFSKIGG